MSWRGVEEWDPIGEVRENIFQNSINFTCTKKKQKLSYWLCNTPNSFFLSSVAVSNHLGFEFGRKFSKKLQSVFWRLGWVVLRKLDVSHPFSRKTDHGQLPNAKFIPFFSLNAGCLIYCNTHLIFNAYILYTYIICRSRKKLWQKIKPRFLWLAGLAFGLSVSSSLYCYVVLCMACVSVHVPFGCETHLSFFSTLLPLLLLHPQLVCFFFFFLFFNDKTFLDFYPLLFMCVLNC